MSASAGIRKMENVFDRRDLLILYDEITSMLRKIACRDFSHSENQNVF